MSLTNAFGDDYRPRRIWEVEGGKVYAGARLVRGADASTFEILNYMYARDARRVYYPFGTVDGADPSPGGTWAKDKYRYYDVGRVSTVEEYFQTLGQMVKGLETMGRSLADGRL